jgi:preprotein translocase subunit SecG
MGYLLGILLALSSLFLILLVLVQQGRGGGLAGAFGGMGGQSAFGTKAGDLFTKVTIVVAAIWILLCVATVKWATSESSPFGESLGSDAPAAVESSKDSGAAPSESTPPAAPSPDPGKGGATPAEKPDVEK